MGLNHSPRIVTTGLVLCLDAANPKSYSGTGTTWTNLIGNGNNGTLINGPTFSSNNGGGIVFDGTNDYCILNSNFFTTSLPNFTISAWFNKTVDGILIGNHYHNSTWESVWFSTTQFTVNGANNNTTNRQTLSYSSPSSNIWHNLVAVNNSSSGFMKVYLNGSEYASLNAIVIPWNSGIPLTIGAQRDISTGGVQVALAGRISQIITYNRAFIAQEVVQNFNALRGRYGI